MDKPSLQTRKQYASARASAKRARELCPLFEFSTAHGYETAREAAMAAFAKSWLSGILQAARGRRGINRRALSAAAVGSYGAQRTASRDPAPER
jgi:hypothetical protein